MYSLDIHLVDQQEIYFEDNTVIKKILQGKPKRTKLLGFFEYNQQTFRINNDLTYIKFAERLAYQPDNTVRSLRKNKNPVIRQKAIGSFPMLTSANGEVFCLKVQLSHIHCKGETYCIGLSTVEGCVLSSFLNASNVLGILNRS